MKAFIETAKMLLRLAILWSPFILSVFTSFGDEGVMAGVSTLLTGLDKMIHESDKVKLNGILPF